MTKSIEKIALIVSTGTFISKAAGFFRQLLIASTFGIGNAYEAYNYAYIIPGFFLIIIGGINGPFHNAMVAVLSRKSNKESEEISSSIHIIVSLVLILFSLLTITLADQIISILGPGLSFETHGIAVIQLKVMGPIILLSGLLGIGYGALNSKNKFLIPSISPLISSLTIIIFVSIFSINNSTGINTQTFALRGGIILAIATVIGVLLQWLIQIPTLTRSKLINIKFKLNLNKSGVKEILKIIIPATFSSGMLQINVFTDLFFASNIFGAASGLSYANFIIQAPLGLISNALIIPLLPEYSKLFDKKNYRELKIKIRQGLILSAASMICLGSILIALCSPLVELIYQRGAFDQNAVTLVSGLLIAYGIGMPAYLSRDLLVRIYYATGDGETPFKLSLIGILLNVFFDWLLVGGPTPWGNQMPFNLGAQGIIFATVIINFLTSVSLIVKLEEKLGTLKINKILADFSKILLSGIASGLITWIITSIIIWPEDIISLSIEIIISSSIGLFVFISLNNYFNIKEVVEITKYLKNKLFII